MIKGHVPKQKGFTLIEVLILLIVLGILANTILLGLNTAGVKMPLILANNYNEQTAKQCIEYFLGQRRLLGYSALTCPSSTVPAFCNNQTGQTTTVNITCTTINSDANYMTIMVSTSSSGSTATLSTLVASY